MADKPVKLTDEQIVSLMNSDFDDAIGAPGGEIARERAEAYDYYLREPFGNEDDEVSEVITSDVADVVDSIMPSLLRIFTTQDNLVSFDPVGPEDEGSSSQESDYVNYIFFKRNSSFELLYSAFWDALVQKTGIWKCWWDEDEDVTTESYEGLSEPELLSLMQDEELEPVERDEREGEDVLPTGELVKTVVHDIEFRRVTKKGQVRVECIPPNEYRISADGSMEGHERLVTRDELVAMGFPKKKVYALPAHGDAISSPDEDARKNKTDDRKASETSVDKSQEKVLLREGYKHMDADGDGRAELMQVFTVDDKLLEKDAADRSPFHTICPAPLPHKEIGMATAEKVMDIQLTSSTILRQTLANLYHSNNPGHGVWEQGLGENTMDDLLTTKVGRVARFARPINESYQPIVIPFTADASFPMMEYFDKAKRDRTGISSDSEGLTPEALKHIQTTVLAQSIDVSKMKVEAIARIFAETGLKSLFLHIHELVRKHQQKAEIVKLRNQWVPVNPSEWRTRENMTVQVGLGIGTREQNLVHLNAIWEKQKEMAEGGGLNLTVTPKNFYNTASEISKNANYKTPEMFFTDPGNQKAPPPADETQQLERMQAEIKQREQQLDAERQTIAIEKLKLEKEQMGLEHQRTLLKLQSEHAADQSKTAVALRKIDSDDRKSLQQLSVDAEGKKFERAEQIAKINKLNAEAAKIRSESGETPEQGPSQAELLKLEEEIRNAEADRQKTEAEIEKIEAETSKVRAETKAQDIENEATETGITDLVNELGAPEEE